MADFVATLLRIAAGISTAATVIILLGVAVACTILVAAIAGNMMKTQVPRTIGLSMQSAAWYAVPSGRGYLYYFDLTMVNAGTEEVYVVEVATFIGNASYTTPVGSVRLRPGEWKEVSVSLETDTPPHFSSLPVRVTFCTSSTRSCYTASALAKRLL